MKLLTIILYLSVVYACGDIELESPNIAEENDYLSQLKEELVKEWPDSKTLNIVFHGHSVPSGYFRTPHVNTLAAYPHLFLKYLKENYQTAVINSITTSIGGEQAEQGSMRFKNDVLTLKPDLLFIDYALNDRRLGLVKAEKAWRSMIEDAINAQVKIVLLTPTPDLSEDILDDDTPLQRHTDMIRELGKEYKIPVVNVYSKFKALKKEGRDIADFMSQGNHPNEKGHEIVLNEIVNELF